MSTTTILLLVAGAAALVDWVAVALRSRRVEYLAKPATVGLLVAAAVTGRLDHDLRWWVVAALVLGAVGDVAIMLSREDGVDGWFLGGVAAFLLGHGAYVTAFLKHGVHGWQLLGGALVAVGVGGLVLPRAISGAVRRHSVDIGLLLLGYSTLLAVMATAAAGTAVTLTAAGGALFVVSDAVLSRERFVAHWRWGRVPAGEVVVAISYHAAQALILLGLLHGRWSHL